MPSAPQSGTYILLHTHPSSLPLFNRMWLALDKATVKRYDSVLKHSQGKMFFDYTCLLESLISRFIFLLREAMSLVSHYYTTYVTNCNKKFKNERKREEVDSNKKLMWIQPWKRYYYEELPINKVARKLLTMVCLMITTDLQK